MTRDLDERPLLIGERRMDYLQREVFLKVVEVAVAVQEGASAAHIGILLAMCKNLTFMCIDQ